MCAGYQGTLDDLPALCEKIERPTLILRAEVAARILAFAAR
jgi:hypothetical protein